MVYAFGGRDELDILMESEVYEIDHEEWSIIPDMPKPGYHNSCVRMKNSIYITSGEFSLMRFTPET